MTHGTRHAYCKLGCRCEPCRAAQSAYQRAWRAKDGPAQERELRATREWKERNREANRTRDREYDRARRAGEPRREIAPFYRFLEEAA